MTKRTIVELTHDYNLDVRTYDDCITYLSDCFNRDETIEAIENMVRNIKGIEITSAQMIVKTLEYWNISKGEVIEKVADNYSEEDIAWAKGAPFNEVVGEFYEDILDEYFENTSDYATLAELHDCYFGYVHGVSQNICYIVLASARDREYAEHLYNGKHFYRVVILDEEGNEIDPLWGNYIRNDEELKEVLEHHFGVTGDFVLVDNEDSRWFNYPKVKQSVAKYQFSEV